MRILRLNKSRRGSAGITYGLAVGLIAVMAVTATQQVGGAIGGLINSTATKINSAANLPEDCKGGQYTALMGVAIVAADPSPLPQTRSGESVTLHWNFQTEQGLCLDGAWQPAEFQNGIATTTFTVE